MRRYSLLQAPFLAFYSRAFFRDVGSSWRVASYVYLLLLLAVSWIPFMVSTFVSWSAFLEDQAPAVTQQIPPITIKDGVVSTEVEQPYFITDGADEPFAIIDTTGLADSLQRSSARLLLTRSQLFVQKNNMESRVYDLSSVDDFYIDAPLIDEWLRILGTWGLALLYPFVVVGSFAYRTVQVLFYAAIGLLMARKLRCPLAFTGIVSVALVAITPAVASKTLLWAAGASFRFSWLFYFAIAMGYLAFGLKANQLPEASDSESPASPLTSPA